MRGRTGGSRPIEDFGESLKIIESQRTIVKDEESAERSEMAGDEDEEKKGREKKRDKGRQEEKEKGLFSNVRRDKADWGIILCTETHVSNNFQKLPLYVRLL
ncbi:hypothetical protein PUN28_013256 [Cardiocondyla obscurior]|uniref:Uncharacterized protein n=1 Tax=Cardiocondyla obscurior TaxID=286306 RepID=A0AAW2FD79_9HYME